MTTLNRPDPAAVLAASVNAPRFLGRAELVRMARTDTTALLALTMTPRQREIAALRQQLSGPVIAALRLPSIVAQAELRADRKAKRGAAKADALAARLPGNVPARALRAAFHAALRTASFRECTNGHETTLHLVDVGHEGAEGGADRVSARSAGMSHAYCRKAYTVSVSEHTFKVSRAFWAIPKAERAAHGLLYLSPELRVKQGRGAALVVQRAPKGAWR